MQASNFEISDQGKSIIITHIFFILELRYLFTLFMFIIVYVCFIVIFY
uniref:Uncharacterized protein n=1 Tax=Arundo donax TaxID=35708 RepID=A0A0A9F1S4_ARUDO